METELVTIDNTNYDMVAAGNQLPQTLQTALLDFVSGTNPLWEL